MSAWFLQRPENHVRSPKLDLWVAVRHYVGAGNQTGSLQPEPVFFMLEFLGSIPNKHVHRETGIGGQNIQEYSCETFFQFIP